MVYRVLDLFENKQLRDLRSLSTHKMDMPVRWIHVAELSEHVDRIGQSVKAGDLLVIMGPILKNDPEKLKEALALSVERGLSGILLYSDAIKGEIPEDIIQYANKHQFPLLQIAGENPSITDLTAQIIRSISEYNFITPEFLPQYIMLDILNRDFYNNIHIFQMRAESIGFDLSVPHQAIWLTATKKKAKKTPKKAETEAPKIHNREWMRCGDMVLNRYYEKKNLQANSEPVSMFLVPNTYVPIRTVAQQMLAACQERDKAGAYCFRIGIGSLHSEIRQFADSLHEARQVVELMEVLGIDNDVRHVDDMILSMLVRANQESPMFQKLYTNNILPLLEMDVAEKYDLVGTLRMYFDCGKNVCKAAENLYLHRNTMKSRLEKIEELTGRDLKDPLDCLELQLALHHYKVNIRHINSKST